MADFEAFRAQNLNSCKVLRSANSVYKIDNIELSCQFSIEKYQEKYYMRKKYQVNNDYNIAHFNGEESKFFEYLKINNHQSLPKVLEKQVNHSSIEYLFLYAEKSLHDIIDPLVRDREGRYLKEDFYRFLPNLRYLIEGLKHIHSYHGHGGICPSQILLRNKDTLEFAPFVPKNIEYNLAYYFGKVDSITLPNLYKAPELENSMLNDNEAVKIADVFSLGLCFMHLICPNLNIFEIWKIVNNRNEEEFFYHIKFPTLAKLIYLMLDKDMSYRATLEFCLTYIYDICVEMIPDKLSWGESNLDINSRISSKFKSLLSVWQIYFNGELYILKSYKFPSTKTINKVIEKKNKADHLLFTLKTQKFISTSKYNANTETDFVIIYTYSGINLQKFLVKSYNCNECYKISYSILEFVGLLIKSDLIHIELTLESFLYQEGHSINVLKVNKILNRHQTTKTIHLNRQKMMPYYPPELLNVLQNYGDINSISLEAALSYSLGILILKIMFFPIKDQILSSTDPIQLQNLISEALKLDQPLQAWVFLMLNPDPVERLKLSTLIDFTSPIPN